MITFGSLFAGIGGIDLGFERAGMQCIWQVEIDDYATKILEKHWPNVKRERDVREVGAHNLEPVDVIAAGFPCQDISIAGAGAGLDGERSGLFFEVVRLAFELRPRIIFLENVAAILGRGMGDVLRSLAEVGYDSEWHSVSAASLGAPHIRERVFVLAYPDSQGLEERQGQESGRSGPIVRRKPRSSSRWATEPNVGRVANGISGRMDRLKGLGNAVVPPVAEYLGRQIVRRLG